MLAVVVLEIRYCDLDDDGDITFSEIKYTTEGTHTYTVSESPLSSKTVSTDTTVYTVTVSVTDNGDGTLSVKPSDNYTSLNFTNQYTPNGEAVLNGTVAVWKVPSGERMGQTANQFSFAMLAAAGESDSPMRIITGPITTGGKRRLINLRPCHLMRADIRK